MCNHTTVTIWAGKQLKQKESVMADKENQVVFVFIGTYGSEDDALMDYAAVKELYSEA